jgi:hypothetical protein
VGQILKSDDGSQRRVRFADGSIYKIDESNLQLVYAADANSSDDESPLGGSGV